MNKHIVVKPTCCIVDEIVYFLESKINGKTQRVTDRSLIDTKREQQIEELLLTLDQIDIVDKSLFKWLNHTKTSLASILLKSFGLTMVDMDRPTYFDELIQSIEQYHQKQVGTLTIFHHIDFDLDHPRYDLLTGLMQLSLDDHDKLLLIDAIYHPKHYIERIQTTLSPFIQWFNDHESRIDHEQYLRYFNDATIHRIFVNTNLNIDSDITVYPSLVRFTDLTINIAADNQLTLLVGLGIDYPSLDHYDFIHGQLDFRLEQLSKVLADKSKMKIIDLLKQQPLYGAKIAALMDLKPSTVSYHLDALMNAGMVKATRENNRIYFEYDKVHTLELLDQLKQRLS